MNNFKIGDVVILKSGGPSMTVSVIKDSDITCAWFNDGKLVERSSFPSDSLKLNA